MKEKIYYPDSTYHLVNIVWSAMAFTMGIVGIFYLSDTFKFNLKSISLLFFFLTIWLNILFSQVSIRRLDKKYLDRLMTDSRVGNFIVIPLAFSRETLIKLKWMRAAIYLFAYSRWPSLVKLRKDIIPEFDYKKDIKLLDKFLFWGQPISAFTCIILGFMVKW